MKRIVIGLSLILAAGTLHAEIVLQPTKSATSVQATLWDALSAAHNANNSDLIRLNSDFVLSVDDGVNALACEAGPRGLAAVQVYACSFKSGDMNWTTSTNTVQAVLWTALKALKDAAAGSGHSAERVKEGRNGALVVEDEVTQLTCAATAFGKSPSYKCQLVAK